MSGSSSVYFFRCTNTQMSDEFDTSSQKRRKECGYVLLNSQADSTIYQQAQRDV